VSAFKLKSTDRRYVLADPSGYSFELVTHHDPEDGWSAHVSFAAHGMRTEDGAIDSVTMAVGEFLRMASHADDVAETPGNGEGDS